MHSAGSSCLMTRPRAVAARKSICGLRLITFSGHVALHKPHCTQASSANRSTGRSGSSDNAPVGHADTQDEAQRATFNANLDRCRMARLPEAARYRPVSGRQRVTRGETAASIHVCSLSVKGCRLCRGFQRGNPAQRVAERIGIICLYCLDTYAIEAEAWPRPVAPVRSFFQAGNIVSCLCASEKPHGRGAIGVRRRDRFKPDSA